MCKILTKRITAKKTILAPAVALSLGLTGALGFATAPVFADETPNTPTSEDKELSGSEKTEEDEGDDQQPDEGEGDDQQPDEGEGDDQQPDDDAEAKDPALSLSDKKVTANDFVNDKKGVAATVSNLDPGTKVKFTVTGTSGNAKNVKPYETTVTANKDGVAVFTIAGLSKSNPSAYIGKYNITAEFDGQTLKDSFEVVSGKSKDEGEASDKQPGTGGGSVTDGASDTVGSSSASGSSDYLPRTGQGLGGLAAGAALLTIGGAAVLLTRRTRKA